jgi:hypothetical protein
VSIMLQRGYRQLRGKEETVAYFRYWNSSVGVTTAYGLDERGSISGGGWEFFSLTSCPDRLRGATQPPIPWVLEALSLEVKRPESEADHSPPS